MKAFRGSGITCLLALVFALTFVFLFNYWLDNLWTEQSLALKTLFRSRPNKIKEPTTHWQNITIDCSCNAPQISSFSPNFTHPNYHDFPVKPEMCPLYFSFIRQDLKPWEKSGITLDVVEKAKNKASFRVIVINGSLFVESYHHCYQTRDLITVWGILQLLRMYPGMVPDLDLMFNCEDKPVAHKGKYMYTQPLPLFHYCGSKDTFDIVFPDWSFWGWAEIQIPPWDRSTQEIQNGNQKVKWADRDPRSYWKGNPSVSPKRKELLKCKKTPNWNGKLYTQIQDICRRQSMVSEPQVHYACNSPTLLITPEFYDFILRGLLPQHHYWPIRPEKKCNSIKFAVDWGNNHTEEAMAIGKAGSDFMLNELKMKYVYDYMFHALREYAKLLKYKPNVTKKAVEYCSDSFFCYAKDAEKVYMEESMVTGSSPLPPCILGEAEWDAKAVRDFIERKAKSMNNVLQMENKAG